MVTIPQPLRWPSKRFPFQMELDFFRSVADVVEGNEVGLVVECCLFGSGGLDLGLDCSGVRLLRILSQMWVSILD